MGSVPREDWSIGMSSAICFLVNYLWHCVLVHLELRSWPLSCCGCPHCWYHYLLPPKRTNRLQVVRGISSTWQLFFSDIPYTALITLSDRSWHTPLTLELLLCTCLRTYIVWLPLTTEVYRVVSIVIVLTVCCCKTWTGLRILTQASPIVCFPQKQPCIRWICYSCWQA